MYKDMKQWTEIRRRVLTENISKRQIMRETGMHRTSLEKILNHSSPPGYQQKTPRLKPKLDGHLDWILGVIESDKSLPKKQRHTATRIYKRLCDECGFTGGYTIVREAVREMKRTSIEVFMPLRHEPGEAQVDYFFALVNMNGVLRKAAFFCMALPYSDMFFIKAFPRECTESFWDGHTCAFNFFNGVPKRITYDNSRIAIKKITGCHKRDFTDGFLELASHYLFKHHFCTIYRANEKGVVEGICKYARSNFLVPVPQVKDFDELNALLIEKCWREKERKLRGKSRCKIELLDDEDFLPIPVTAFDACQKKITRANSLSLIRFDANDYSVPVSYAHHELIIKGYVDRVEVSGINGEKVTCHNRIWGSESISYNPLHYLPLLERKPGALDYAEPLFNFELPKCFESLRRKMESQSGYAGTKDYISTLSLIGKYSLPKVEKAINKVLDLQCSSLETIKLYCLHEEVPETTIFCLDGREHLRSVNAGKPNLRSYGVLCIGEGVA